MTHSRHDNEQLYFNLFNQEIPLLDVRAPVEFLKGAFSQASNHPLLTDSERQRIGATYKQSGQEAAIELGHLLVNDSTKEERVKSWQQWYQQNPAGWLYCFRGGLRSQIVQEWLSEAGVECPRVPGGYKALRQFLIDKIDRDSELRHFVVLAGPTGSGKTALLKRLDDAIDLEGLAGHRGSAFGTQLAGQPTQINFENDLAVQLLKQHADESAPLFIEDESQAIGSLSVPHSLYKTMKLAPMALVREPLETRTRTILNDYICDNLHTFTLHEPERAFTQFSTYLLDSLSRIQRRLGGDRYAEVHADMQEAIRIQNETGQTDAHSLWISKLLTYYYDPMYAYQLSKRKDKIVFEGSGEDFLLWARQQAKN